MRGFCARRLRVRPHLHNTPKERLAPLGLVNHSRIRSRFACSCHSGVVTRRGDYRLGAGLSQRFTKLMLPLPSWAGEIARRACAWIGADRQARAAPSLG